MTDHELADHAERLHGLAAARTGTRDDLIKLRDLLPQLLERFRAQLENNERFRPTPKIRVEDIGQYLEERGIEPLVIPKTQ
jgi:hypothetical protein